MDKKEPCNLTGKLLLATPRMGDPRFERSVIFMCTHDEHGAMGLIINSKIEDVSFCDLLEQLKINDPEKNPIQLPVMNGGPVETGRGFILHSNELQLPDAIQINTRFHVSGTIDAVKAIAHDEETSANNLLFILGYAGWSPGQLDSELLQNAWLTADPDYDLVFQSSPDKKWDKAIHRLGIDPFFLSSDAGHA